MLNEQLTSVMVSEPLQRVESKFIIVPIPPKLLSLVGVCVGVNSLLLDGLTDDDFPPLL